MRTYIDSLKCLLVGLLVLTACSEEEATTETSLQESALEEAVVTASAAMPQDTDTRLTGKEGSTGLSFSWESTDNIAVMRGKGGTPVTFSNKNNATGDKVTFTGSMGIDNQSIYYAYYPSDATYADNSITVDISNQTGKFEDIGKNIYMYAQSSLTADNKLDFSFSHFTSVMKLTMTFPTTDASGNQVTDIKLSAGGLATSGTAVITSGEVTVTETGDIVLENAQNITLTGSDGKYATTFYLHLLPASELKNFMVTAKVGDDYYEGIISSSTSIEQKKYYTTSVEMSKIDYTTHDAEAAVKGDFLLSSGGFMAPRVYDTYADKTTYSAIGVVAYLYDDANTPTNLKVSYGDDATTTTRGLVLSLKNYVSTPAWTSGEEKVYYTSSYTTLSDAYAGDNGYQICSYLKENKECLAIQRAMEYSTVKANNDDALGWYLPSIGEWMLILSSDGIGGDSSKSVADMKDGSVSTTDTGTLSDICTSLDGYLSAGGNTDYSKFSTGLNQSYWSSTESRTSQVRQVYFSTASNNVNFSSYGAHKSGNYVRAVLAF